MNELDDKQTLLLLRTMCFKEHALFEKNVPLLMPKVGNVAISSHITSFSFYPHSSWTWSINCWPTN